MRHLVRYTLCSGLALWLGHTAVGQSTTPTIPGGGSQQGGGNLQGNQGSTQPPINGANRNPTVVQNPTGTLPPTTAGSPDVLFGALTQYPFFSEQALRTQLGLTAEQYARLAAIYVAAFNNYNRGIAPLANLPEPQRREREAALASLFYNEFGHAANGVVDPGQQTRLRQIWYQYRGFLAFTDPTVRQQLQLTSTQLDQIRRMEANYTRQLNDIFRRGSGDRDEAARSFSSLRRQMMDDISSVLTDSQRRIWQGVVGNSYNFQPFVPAPTVVSRP